MYFYDISSKLNKLQIIYLQSLGIQINSPIYCYLFYGDNNYFPCYYVVNLLPWFMFKTIKTRDMGTKPQIGSTQTNYYDSKNNSYNKINYKHFHTICNVNCSIFFII